MNLLDCFREDFIEKNEKEYGEDYRLLKWLGNKDAAVALEERAAILSFLEEKISYGYHNTKLDCSSLSPGCKICGEGNWSCLFISGKCNCKCFYCPSEQEDLGDPVTNTIPFKTPDDYADYIRLFDFRGASISGGEPLITFSRTLDFIKKLRENTSLHIWLYTNGTLLDKEKVKLLADAGLDEIRFDIGAVNYKLDKAKLAVDSIKTVTVEIPAIPEEMDLLKDKVREMENEGIRFLNLHQLRLTPYNFPKLVNKGYTFLHGEKVTVLESELTALRLLKFTKEQGINLPINYCSFVYKNRFQKSAYRKRYASFINKPYEDITGNGYIRSLGVPITKELLCRQVEIFTSHELDESLWYYNSSLERLLFNASLWKYIEFNAEATLFVNYYEPLVLPSVSYRNVFKEIALNKSRKIAVERRLDALEIQLSGPDIRLFEREVLNKAMGVDLQGCRPEWKSIIQHEFIPYGLQDYF